MLGDDEYLTSDGMPMQRCPTIRIIFRSQNDKEKFLELLSNNEIKLGLKVGASDEKPLLEVDDVSVQFDNSI